MGKLPEFLVLSYYGNLAGIDSFVLIWGELSVFALFTFSREALTCCG